MADEDVARYFVRIVGEHDIGNDALTPALVGHADHGREGDRINYVKGANIAGFVKVADAMCDQGLV